MAGNHVITLIQGDTFNFNFRLEIDDEPWNLTSYTAKMQVRESSFATNKLLDLSTTSGITLTSSGHVSCTASSTVTSSLPVGRWIYDFELTSPDNTKTTILQDSFIISPQVTQ